MAKGKNRLEHPFDLEDRLIAFAGRVVEVVSALPKTQVGKHLGGQLLRCGTSPMANYAEAQGAESRNDFVHKMKVCLKELRETLAWLKLIQRRRLLGGPEKTKPIVAECDELVSIFVASVNTALKSGGR